MKKIIISAFFTFFACHLFAQSVTPDSMSIQAVIDACVSMRDAAASQDTAAIRKSAEELKSCNATNFSTLRCKDDSVASLNGHLVFNEAFADSLADGKDAYQNADDISRTTSNRGQSPNGKILTKTCFVKAGQSTKYSFVSRGYQELAVVAEAGGLVTMKIHVTNSAGLDERHDDTTNVKKGMPQRKTCFNLPSDRSNTVVLEVINCGNKDISFVVISN